MKMNLANKITIARIIMVFIFLIICNIDEFLPEPMQLPWKITGLVFIILAGFTDILDGYIARKYNMVTDFGKLMDPLADKIFTATAFVMLVDKQCLPGWVAVVILSREFMVTGLRLLAANKGEVISSLRCHRARCGPFWINVGRYRPRQKAPSRSFLRL